MKVTDKESKALELLVGQLEANSSAEIVFAVAEQSGSYGDFDLAPAAAASWLTMGGLIFSPFVFPDWSLLPAVLLAFFLGGLLARYSGYRHWLPRARARRQVLAAARSAFVQEHVSATKDRSGILVYLSEREGEAQILADYGVQAVIPDAHWNAVVDQVGKAPREQRLSTLIAALEPCAALLADRLPRQDDDRDELSNAVRRVS